MIDNTDIICQHKKFLCFNEINDIDRPFCLISTYEWSWLKKRWPCNFEISIYVSIIENSPKIIKSVPEICMECSDHLKQVHESEASFFFNKSIRIIEKSPHSNYPKPVQIPLVSHTMPLSELKLHIYQTSDIAPSEQQLTYNDILLRDDSKMLSEYGINPLKPIYLERVKDSNPYLDPITISPQREFGFEGTIFSGPVKIEEKKIEKILIWNNTKNK